MTEAKLDKWLAELKAVLMLEPKLTDDYTGAVNVQLSQGGYCDAELIQKFKVKRKYEMPPIKVR